MYVTKEGLRGARHQLVEFQRQVSNAQGETAEMYNNAGDTWHDNPGWYAAQQRQSVAERQLSALKRLLLHNLRFIEELEIDGRKVTVGCTVGVEDDLGYRDLTILGPLESNPGQGIVSYESPIAKALESKSIGDSIHTPDGYECRIVSISRWCPSST